MNLGSSYTDDDDGEDVDEAFFRSQAAALAQALREADQRQHSTTATTTTRSTGTATAEALAHETYRQLCFDDPIVTSAGCQALAEALVQSASSSSSSPSPGLALSNRLVDGVGQLCHQQSGPLPSPPAAKGSTAETPASSSLLTPTSTATQSDASGRALLAWTVYGRLPLLLLMSDHLAQATAILGSFRAAPVHSSTQETTRLSEQEAWEKHQQQQQQQPQQHETNATTATPHDEDDDQDLAEVWAAESDPSDFDYGSEPTPAQRLAELEHMWPSSSSSSWAVAEPTALSQPLPDTTWDHVAAAVTALLQDLTYTSALADLPGTASFWKRHSLVDQLTQLTMTLLLPSTMPGDLFRQYSDNHWQQLALKPLHAFRDAVDAHTEVALLEEYCNLLVLLLQANHHVGPPTSSPTVVTETVAPATLVGLGALATLCHSCTEQHRNGTTGSALRIRPLRETILRVVDDLARVLESTEVAVPWTCLSLWPVLTMTTTTKESLTTAHAQRLLQSGVFSQWMLSWQRQDNLGLRDAMQDSIFQLSCAVPTLLGKYAWRFADFAATVTSESNHAPETRAIKRKSSTFLWNLLGTLLAAQAVGGLVSLKKKESSTAPPSADVCRSRAIAVFQGLCDVIVGHLEAWKRRRESTVTEGPQNSPDLEEDATRALDDFREIVDALSIPMVRSLFLKEVCSDAAAGFSINTTVAPIRRLLGTWPTKPHVEDTKESAEEENQDAGVASRDDAPKTDTDHPKRRVGRTELEDSAVASLRRDLKVLQSVFESESSVGQFSSKAD